MFITIVISMVVVILPNSGIARFEIKINLFLNYHKIMILSNISNLFLVSYLNHVKGSQAIILNSHQTILMRLPGRYNSN